MSYYLLLVGQAKRRKELVPNYGKPGLKRGSGLNYRKYEEGEGEYEKAVEIYAEMKERGMTLDQFRKRFSEELEVIRVGLVGITWEGSDVELEYTGRALIVKHQLEKDPEAFPFSDADDPEAKVPSEVFDYFSSLSSLYNC